MAKNIFTRHIGGGLDLDTPPYLVGQDKVTDAINVSHMYDGQKKGILNPCLGIKHTNYIFKTRVREVKLVESINLFDQLDPFYACDCGDKSVLICSGSDENETPVTTFYLVQEHDFEEEADTFDYEVIELCRLWGEAMDESYDFAIHSFRACIYLYISRIDRALRKIVIGDSLNSVVESYFNTGTKGAHPIVTGFKYASSLIFPSITKYSFRVRYSDNTYSNFSKLSDSVTIPADYPKSFLFDENPTWKYVDEEFLTLAKSNVCVKVECDVSSYENASYVELYAIRYISNDGLSVKDAPIVEWVGTEKWEKTVEFVDGVTVYSNSVSNIDFNKIKIDSSLIPLFSSAGSICIKDNVFYAANVSSSILLSSGFNYDPRVWQFNQQKNAVDNLGHVHKFSDLVAKRNSTIVFTQNDCMDMRDSTFYASSTDDDTPYCMFQLKKTVFGAEGKNVLITFVKGVMDYGGVYPEADSDLSKVKEKNDNNYMGNPEYKFSQYVRGLNSPSYCVGLDAGKQHYSGKWFSENTTPDGSMANSWMPIVDQDDKYFGEDSVIPFTSENRSTGHSFCNPAFSSKFKCMQHDSVYRLGCSFVLEDDTETDIFFMGDIRTPSMSTKRFRLFDDHVKALGAINIDYPVEDDNKETLSQHVEMRFFPLFMMVEFNNLPSYVKRVRLFYATRNISDRNIYAMGVVHKAASPFNDPQATNSFYNTSEKHSLPPLPILRDANFFFGGIMGKINTDYYNAGLYHHVPKTDELKGERSVYEQVCMFNNPGSIWSILGIRGVGRADANMRIFYPSQVVVNGGEHTPAYLFYSPELDYLDKNNNPYLSILGSHSKGVMAFSFCCFLSSLFPAGIARGNVSSVYSPMNDSFYAFMNQDTVSQNGGIYTDRTNLTKNSCAFYDGLLMTNNFMDAGESPLYGENADQACTMFFNASVAGSNADKKPKIVNGSQYPKVLKYFIPWDKYMEDGTEKDISLLRPLFSDYKFFTHGLTSPKDIFQYLFPNTFAGFHPSAYGSSEMPSKIKPHLFATIAFVNMAPLWSGSVNILGTDFASGGTRFPDGSFITQSSCRDRNHMLAFNKMLVEGASVIGHTPSVRVPYYWANKDAALTPISDHCLPMDLAGQDKARPNFDPDRWRIAVKDNKCYSNITWDSDVMDKQGFPGKTFSYPQGTCPSMEDYVFQDVKWVCYQQKMTEWRRAKNEAPKDCALTTVIDEALMELKRLWLAETGVAPEFYGSLTADIVCGLNNHGYGGNGIAFFTKDEEQIPGYKNPFECVGDGGSGLLKRSKGAPSLYQDSFRIHVDDPRPDNATSQIDRKINYTWLKSAIDKGSNVILSQLRNPCIPYSSRTMEATTWNEVLLNHLTGDTNKNRYVATNFDMFVGVHKRMYLNAFYPDGIMIKGDTSHPSSVPIMMMFPCESMINMDIANSVDDMYNPDNPSGNSDLKRISPFGGVRYKVNNTNFTAECGTHEYNPVYSSYIESTKTASPLVEVDDSSFPCRIHYSEFNFSDGAFSPFIIGNSIDVDHLYGGINKIYGHLDNLYAFQDRAVAVMFPKNRTVLNDSEGRNIFIGTGGIFSEGYRYVSCVYGAAPDVVVGSTQSSVYWTDSSSRCILRISGNEIEPISTSKDVSSYIEEIVAQYGSLPPHNIYTNYDGTVRFVYDCPDLDHDSFFNQITTLGSHIFRGCIEFNEYIGCFSSFITMKADTVCKINGKNIFFLPLEDSNLPLAEGTYDGYFYSKDSDVDPRISVVVNPAEKFLTKEYYNIYIESTDIPARETILDVKIQYPPFNDFERTLQVFHHPKVKDSIIPMYDGLNHSCFTSQLETSDVVASASSLGERYIKIEYKTTTTTTFSYRKLARAQEFGQYIDVPLDKITNKELGTKKETSTTYAARCVCVNFRFQTFNENSTDEIGRTVASNKKDAIITFTNRRNICFEPFSISYGVIDRV